MQKTLIVIGVAILVIGLLWPYLSKLPLGRLPGDIAVKTENSRFYFPITSMILVSLVLSLLLNFFRR